MANRTKFLHFKTSAGFYAEIERNSGLSGDAALKATNNGCFYFICFIQETDQIYTHGNLYNCSEFDDTDLQDQINVINESLENKANKSELEENERVIAAALTDFNNTKADRSEIPDSSSFATRDDLNILSANFNNLDANKITSGTISIERLPVGALERLFVVESEAAAISATVQEGDVVQVTGNNNKMYFCISNTATTFATKFKEFTAGTATSVPWSGITGKPTGIDGWGDRIGVIESGYATQSWVVDNYLSKSGGKIIGKGDYAWVQLRLSGNIATIMFEQNEVEKGCIGWMGNTGIRLQNSNEYGLAVTDSNVPIFYWGENGSVQRTLLHSGNYADYALPKTGGTLTGQDGILVLKSTNSSSYIAFDYNNTRKATVGVYNGLAYISNETIKTCPRIGVNDSGIPQYWDGYEGKNKYTLLHSGNYSSYALPITGGTMTGNITLQNNKSIIQNQSSTSNYTVALKWLQGGVSEATSDPQIGHYNIGDTNGAIVLLPYSTDAEVWNGNDGLYIGSSNLKFNGTKVSLDGHTHSWSDINNTITASNEFNFVYEGFNSSLWVNYRSKTNTNVTIKEYHFGNGSGGLAPCYATNFIISSDKRLKTNIKEIYNAAKSLELGFYEFDYKNGGHSAGHVAQDVREVLPAFVHGKESETEYLSVDYTGLHSMQIKALIDEINSLKKENEELKKSNKEIHTRVEKIEEMLVMLKES